MARGTIDIDNTYAANEMRSDRRNLALDVALNIYHQFGWENPPKDELQTAQRQRFGEPRGSK